MRTETFGSNEPCLSEINALFCGNTNVFIEKKNQTDI